jgi:hypothetical protein
MARSHGSAGRSTPQNGDFLARAVQGRRWCGRCEGTPAAAEDRSRLPQGVPAGWEAQLARLVAYKAAHGDCNKLYVLDRKLQGWCQRQRRVGKSKMAAARVSKLDAVGFAWACGRGRRRGSRGVAGSHAP